MKKIILFFAALAVSGMVQSQVISSSRWTDLFSYNNVLAIREDNGKLIAATENGIFYYNINSGEISKLSKANGLHQVKITAFDYNPETGIGLVGYKNGSMDVISPEGITLVVDIPIATGFSGDKKINHISINGNQAVISVAYGVSVFNLERKEFEDTCFFISGNNYVAAKESVIKNNKVYTVTESGLKTHEIDVMFPVFSSWATAATGSFKHISGKDVIAFSDGNTVRYGDGTSFNTLGSFSSVNDVFVTDDNIVVTDGITVKVYTTSGAAVKNHDFGETLNTAIYLNNQIYAGCLISGIKNEAHNKLKPDGPYYNYSYKIDIFQNQIVISSGGRQSYSDAITRWIGYYHFDGTSWHYPDYFITNPVPNVIDAVIDRENPNQIFFVNYLPWSNSKGIYRMENHEFKNQYLGTPYNSEYIAGLAFDENKQLFASVSHIEDKYIGYFLYNRASDSFTVNKVIISGGVQKPIPANGVLYIPSPFTSDGGMLIYNYNNTPATTSDDSYIIIRKNNNLPVNGTVSASLDKNDNLWIGTRLGLRVLSNPVEAITESEPQTEPVVIEENGLGEELFRDSQILQITTDSGNQKWVSVDGGGVFYLSSSGDQTFQHFTQTNSPLPTDSVTDIKVDETNGKVYFVTLDGVVVYQGDVVNASENFGDVLVYPNPVVYANYKGNVRIRGLAEKTNIRITDAAGNLVHQAVARGGFYEWNLNNQRGVRVASGIYFVLMTNEDGTDTATAKIAVVN
ncbi:MAG: T9SS type A sorting domain-containing protein [Bergeyella sp.]